MIFTLTVSCAFLHLESARADTSDPINLFDEALQANAGFENQRLQDIVAGHPEMLLVRSETGLSLIEYAFVFINDDLVSQTNFDFLKHLSSNNFYDQEVDRSEHFSFAMNALRAADDQIGRIDLPDDMVVHRTREPFLSLLSETIAYRLPQNPLSSEDSVMLILDICDPSVFQPGQESFVGTQLSQAIASSLTLQLRNFVDVYVQTGTVNANCVAALLN